MANEYQPLIADVTPVGVYGPDLFVNGGDSFAERYPYQLQNFKTYAAMDGPQVMISWDPPASDVNRIIIVRKQYEFPRDIDDGVVVHDTNRAGISIDTTLVADLGADLVADAALGAVAWWYYRAFTQPKHLELADQFGGLAKQVITPVVSTTCDPLDVQAFRNVGIHLQNETGAVANITIFSTPTLDPLAGAVVISTLALVGGGATFIELDHASWKYLWVESDRITTVWFTVNREPIFQTSMGCSSSCLAYRSGYHLDVWWRKHHVPDFWRLMDESEGRPDRARLVTTLSFASEVVNQNELQNQTYGPLFRLLKVLSLELDRVKAHMDALTQFGSNIDEAPDFLLQHIAFQMGWNVDLTRPLLEVRDELLRIPTLWKQKGTARQLENVAAQTFEVIARIQASPGMVHRFADPVQWIPGVSFEQSFGIGIGP